MIQAEGRRFGGQSEIAWTVERYLAGGADPQDPLVSPLWAADHAGLPSAHVVTAGYDPLVDEGRAFVRALQAAGVEAAYYLDAHNADAQQNPFGPGAAPAIYATTDNPDRSNAPSAASYIDTADAAILVDASGAYR